MNPDRLRRVRLERAARAREDRAARARMMRAPLFAGIFARDRQRPPSWAELAEQVDVLRLEHETRASGSTLIELERLRLEAGHVGARRFSARQRPHVRGVACPECAGYCDLPCSRCGPCWCTE